MTGVAYELEPRSPEERMGELDNVLLYKSQHEPNPGNRACLKWLRGAVQEEPIKEAVHSMFKARPRMQGLYAANLIMRDVWYIEDKADPDFKLGQKKEAKDWEIVKEHLEQGENYGEFWFNLLCREIATVKGGRAKAVKAFLLGSGVNKATIAELGSSQGHNLLMLDEEHITNVYPTDTKVGALKSHEGRHEFVEDKGRSKAFDNAINGIPFSLKFGLGTDIMNPFHEMTRGWIKACSLYYDEQNTDEVALFNKLSEARSPVVRILAPGADMREPLDLERLKREIPEAPTSYDFALLSFSAYQLSEDLAEFEDVVVNALKVAKKVLCLDAVSFDEQDRPVFHDNTKPYAITLNLLDGDNLDVGWQKMFTANNGRIQRLIPEPAFMRLPYAQEVLGR